MVGTGAIAQEETNEEPATLPPETRSRLEQVLLEPVPKFPLMAAEMSLERKEAAAKQLGDVAAYRKALDDHIALGPGTLDLAATAFDRALWEQEYGSPVQALRMFRTFATQFRDSPYWAYRAQFSIGATLYSLGRFDEWESARSQSERRYEELMSSHESAVRQSIGRILNARSRAGLARLHGDTEKSLPNARTAFTLSKELYSRYYKNSYQPGSFQSPANSRSTGATYVFGTALRLLFDLRMAGRIGEAESFLKEYEGWLHEEGFAGIHLANIERERARNLLEAERYDDAMSVLEHAIAEYATKVDVRWIASAEGMIGSAYAAEHEWDSAISAYQRAARTGKASLLDWAYVELQLGRPTEALELLSKTRTGAPSDEDSRIRSIATRMALEGAAMHLQGDDVAGLAAFRKSWPLVESTLSPQHGLALDELDFLREQYLAVLDALFKRSRLHVELEQLATEAIRILESRSDTRVNRAVVDSATRALLHDNDAAELIHRASEMALRLDANRRALAELSFLPNTRRLPAEERRLIQRIDEIEASQHALREEISSRLPTYAEIAALAVPTSGQISSALKSGCVYVSIRMVGQSVFVLVVGSDGVRTFTKLPTSSKELQRMVHSARQLLEFADDLDPSDKFDFSPLYAIYAAVLGPVESYFGDATQIIISSASVVSSVPFAALLYRDCPGSHALEYWRTAPWLVDRYSLSNVPSATAFVRLSALESKSRGQRTFLGFGDPVFAIHDSGITPPATMDRSDGTLVTQSPAFRLAYGHLRPLPESGEELRGIASALGVDVARSVRLGRDATRVNVLSSDLRTIDVLAFATHAIAADDLPGIAQPALALSWTPGMGDPLLALDDVFALRLSGAIVVLSGCNTGGADGSNGESLSGLVRGFFFSGSRAVIATHWSVESHAATRVIPSIFQYWATQRYSSKLADALRRAQIELRKDRGTSWFAHPAIWAPFFFEGAS